MNKKEYQAPNTKIKCYVSEHSFMQWTDWGDAKKGQFYEFEDEELNKSSANVWDY